MKTLKGRGRNSRPSRSSSCWRGSSAATGIDFRDYSPASLTSPGLERGPVRGPGHDLRAPGEGAPRPGLPGAAPAGPLGQRQLDVPRPRLLPGVATKVVPLLRTYPFIRVWNAGCSTGEEVYSVAILLQEEGLYERSRIYATDLNGAVLKRAREGIFPLRGDAGVHSQLPEVRGLAVVLGVLHRRARPRHLPPVAAGEHRLLAAQPGDRRLVQRVPPDPVPQCHDLLPGPAPGPRPQTCCTRASPRLGSSGWGPRSRFTARRTRTITSRWCRVRNSTGGCL